MHVGSRRFISFAHGQHHLRTYVSGSTDILGVSQFSFMSFLPRPVHPETGKQRFLKPYLPTFRMLAILTNAALLSAAQTGWKPNVGRKYTGCTVGMEPFESPVFDMTSWPPLMMFSGRTPKCLGRYSTRSAILPTSTDPTCCEMPCAMAGLIVYLAT